MRNEYHIIVWKVTPNRSKANWAKGLSEVKRGADSSYIPHLRGWLTTRATVDSLEKHFGASATGINRGSLVVECIKRGSREDCLRWAEIQRG